MTIDSKVWARLPENQYIYFFRKIYAGEKGIKQELVARFFEALYKECIRKGLKPEWDTGSYAAINKLMSNLNFNEQRRRASHSSSKRSTKPYVAPDDPGAADGARPQVS